MTIRGVQMKVENLTHRYTERSPLTFDGVDISAEPGESLIIIGRSGCGKSTLLHIIAGLLDSTSGSLKLDDEEVTGPSPRWVMMFQAPHLFPWMTVESNVGVGLRFSGWPKDKIAAKVEEAISLVELEEYAKKNTQDLSGGQQQRVALARSLVMEPELLLLDEPFSALDAFTRASLQDDVANIVTQEGLTLVIVTHDIDEAVAMADRVLIMSANPGQIVGEVSVDLPFPRNRSSAEFSRQREQLMTQFENLVGDIHQHEAEPEAAPQAKSDSDQKAA
jgi:ABC-type nitrate/sulfonate/bicarbonate transport system ATPase subunit